jgi:hypothetical protein
MPVTLDTLELPPAQLEACQDEVRRMAYFRWLDAGAPAEGQLDFWLEAENEWIEFNYVPHRMFDGTRPCCKRTNPEDHKKCDRPPRHRCGVKVS